MKNQEVYIPRPAKAMMAEIESLKAALAVAIAERDEFHRCLLAREESLKQSGEDWVKAKTELDIMTSDRNGLMVINEKHRERNQSLTTLCAERDALHKNCIKQYDWEEHRAKNQSLTTCCAELQKALEFEHGEYKKHSEFHGLDINCPICITITKAKKLLKVITT